MRIRFPAPALLAVLAGCVDRTPTSPEAIPSGGSSQISPARAWLEVGSAITLSASPASPFSLAVHGPPVVSFDGARLSALAPGTADLDIFFPTGRDQARVTVLSRTASMTSQLLDQGLTDVSLLGVWSADPATIFAVGTDGTVLLTRDGGASWQKMDSGIPDDLTSIWGSGPGDVYAVGAHGVAIHYDGISWQRITLPTTEALLGVWGIDAAHVYVVGANTAFQSDGVSWSVMQGAVGSELWAIWGTHPDTLFASGQNGVVLRWDGATWRRMTTPTQYILFGLWGPSANEVYAAGIRGTVLKFDGASWTPVQIPSQADFFAIAGTSHSNVVIVGNGGAVVSFNGTAWTRAPQVATYENLRDIYFDQAGTARVVGWSGAVIERGRQGWKSLLASPILITSALGGDGELYLVGASGTLVRQRPTGEEPVGILLRRDLYGIARTTDGLVVVGDSGAILGRYGDHWQIENAPTRVLLRAVWADSTDPNAVYASGDQGTIIHRSDGVWRREPTPTPVFLRHIWGLDGRDVFAVGDSGLILRNQGNGWIQLPTTTKLRLRSIWGTGPDNLIVVGEAGIALRFDGRHWYPIDTGTDKELRAVGGIGPTDIYAVGQDGIILRFDGSVWTKLPSPTPAFLLSLTPGPNRSLVSVGTNRTVLELHH